MAQQTTVIQLSQQYRFSQEAVAHLWETMVRGNGSMAQFNHPELGGSGQWMQNGMLMIGDMFNHQLKSRVDALCNAMSPLVLAYLSSSEAQSSKAAAVTITAWWPTKYGQPSATGSQNNTKYAYFGPSRRLVVENEGKQTTYDTGHHTIGGFSQQQPSAGELTFQSQHGSFTVSSLTIVEP